MAAPVERARTALWLGGGLITLVVAFLNLLADRQFGIIDGPWAPGRAQLICRGKNARLRPGCHFAVRDRGASHSVLVLGIEHFYAVPLYVFALIVIAIIILAVLAARFFMARRKAP